MVEIEALLLSVNGEQVRFSVLGSINSTLAGMVSIYGVQCARRFLGAVVI